MCPKSSTNVQQVLCENCSICRCILDVLVRRDELRILLFHHLDPSLSCWHRPCSGLGRPRCKCGWSTPARQSGFCGGSGVGWSGQVSVELKLEGEPQTSGQREVSWSLSYAGGPWFICPMPSKTNHGTPKFAEHIYSLQQWCPYFFKPTS